ncbi:MAG: mevalonate kinase [Candidatus Helarchaeota archaeon]
MASAPGKCILTGEHAVVYNASALVVALNIYATTKIELRSDKIIQISLKDYNLQERLSFEEKSAPKSKPIFPIWQILLKFYNTYGLFHGLNIEICSDIPMGVGLGSSAAVSVSFAAALNNLYELHLGPQEISRYALEAEKITHSNPSGIDNAISTYGGALLYKQGKINRIEVPFEIPLLIINSKVSHETKTQVKNVAKLFDMHPSFFKRIFEAIDTISLKAENALRLQKLELLGELLNYNQQLLQILGVSTKELESLIELVRSQGAIGAKLTGAGGGGCIVALFGSKSIKQECINQLESFQIPFYDSIISEYGFRILHTAKS